MRNAFRKVCNQNIIEKAVKTSPKEAGIDDMIIDRVAEQTITNETNKVSAISFVSGLPGGLAMAGTIPADLAQYFAHIIIVAQELGYIYGWREICSVENELHPEAASLLIMFIGIMFEVEGVAGTLGKIAYSTIAKTTGEQITKLAGIKFLQVLQYCS